MTKCKQINELLVRAKYAIEKKTKAQSDPHTAYRVKTALIYRRSGVIEKHFNNCKTCIKEYPEGENSYIDAFKAFLDDLPEEYEFLFLKTEQCRAEEKEYWESGGKPFSCHFSF